MLHADLVPHRTSLPADAPEPQKLFAMLRVTPAAPAAFARPQVAIIFVCDTSDSMRDFVDQDRAREEFSRQDAPWAPFDTPDGRQHATPLTLPTKLDEAIHALHCLIEDRRLTFDDLVGVCRFDETAATVLPLSPIAEHARGQSVHAAVNALREHHGGTRMANGLRQALADLSPVPRQVARRVVVLTDGRTFDEEECLSLVEQFAATNTPIIAVGVGDRYNEQILLELAARSGGRPYHLGRVADLQNVLLEEIGSVVREVVLDLQAEVITAPGVALERFTRVYPSLAPAGRDEHLYRLGNVAAGDDTVFVLELTVQCQACPPGPHMIAEVRLAGAGPAAGPGDSPPSLLMRIDFASGGRQGGVNQEVLGYVQQVRADRLIQEAMRLPGEDRERTRALLEEAAAAARRAGNAAVADIAASALDELDRSGRLSPERRKTAALGARTSTLKPGDGPADERIRELTGA